MDVVHNEDLKRFEMALDGQLAVAEYTIQDNDIYFTHTEVPPAFKGQGIASTLARAALEFAREHGYTVHAQCEFIARYIQRHPEYHPITQGYKSSKSS